MSWVSLKKNNKYEMPRKMTEEEINTICNNFPLAPCADKFTAEFNRNSIIEWIKENLKNEEIVPSLIPILIQNILKQHYKSLAIPANPIGITAAEAIGATTTQLTLNSIAPWEELFIFHNNNYYTTKIGTFIDALLTKFKENIILIPKNRTEFLNLNELVLIETIDEKGNLSWEKVSAVTRHLPIGKLVRIRTKSGKEVTATQSKSFLIWKDDKFIQEKGSNIKIGDFVPCNKNKITDFKNTYYFKNDVFLDEIISIFFMEPTEYVYDLTVPVTTNFCLYNGLGMADTFHKSGSVNSVSAGIESMSNIINASKEPKHEICDIFFENKFLTYEEALNIESEIVSATMKDFYTDYIIDKVSNIDRSQWFYASENPPESTYMLRLYLNINAMRKYKMSVANLSEIFYKEENLSITPIFGSTLDEILDLYPTNITSDSIEKLIKLKNVPRELFELTHLESFVIPELKIKKINKGLNGLINFSIEEYPILDTILEEKKDKNNLITIIFDKKLLYNIGIPMEKIIQLYKLCNYDIIEQIDNKMIVSKENLETETIMDINKLIQEEEKLLNNETRGDIKNASLLIYAKTIGNNLIELLDKKGIDKQRTTCNNMHIVNKVLGIEATRRIIIKELYNIIKQTGDVNPMNILIIAEFITSRGEPFGINYTGISRQPGGHLSLATIKQAKEVFAKNALHSKKEDIRNVSASITVGQRMSIGSGMFDIAQDIVENGIKRTIINGDIYTEFKNDDYYKNIESYLSDDSLDSINEKDEDDYKEEKIKNLEFSKDVSFFEDIYPIEGNVTFYQEKKEEIQEKKEQNESNLKNVLMSLSESKDIQLDKIDINKLKRKIKILEI